MKIFLLHSKSDAQIFVYVVENCEYCNRKASKKPLAELRILSTAQYIRNMEEIKYHHRLRFSSDLQMPISSDTSTTRPIFNIMTRRKSTMHAAFATFPTGIMLFLPYMSRPISSHRCIIPTAWKSKLPSQR